MRQTGINWLFLLILFLLPLQTVKIVQELFVDGEKWQYGTLLFPLIELVVWVFVLSGVKKNKRIEWKKHWSFALVFVYALLRSLSALEPLIALQQLRFVLFPVLLILFFKDSRVTVSIKKILTATVLSSVVISLFSLIQFFLQRSFFSTLLGISDHIPSLAGSSVVVSAGERWLRNYGVFVHPNIFGGYLLVLVSVSFLWFLLEKNRTSLFRVFLSAAILIQTAALFTTFSRSAWMGLVVAIMTMLVMFKHDYIAHIRQVGTVLFNMVFIGVILVNFFPAATSARIFGGSSNELASTQERLDGYGQAIEIIQEYPVFGTGAGNYTFALAERYPNAPVWSYQPVHNVDLLFIAEWGMIGVLLCLWILWFYRKKIFEKYHAITVLSVAIFLVPALFDHYVLSSYSGLLLIGVYIALVVRIFQEYGVSTAYPPKHKQNL